MLSCPKINYSGVLLERLVFMGQAAGQGFDVFAGETAMAAQGHHVTELAFPGPPTDGFWRDVQ
jgi:hypothetical protein